MQLCCGIPLRPNGSLTQTATDDFVFSTEFGSDMWTYVLQAGFSSVTANTVDFPAALALSARKSGPQCRSDAASWLWPQ